MVLENKRYVPTLAIRPSEMNGLERLPGATKDRMTPCILLAPWVNANTLDKAMDRAEQAFHGRNYILDIDRGYQFTNLESGPQQELAQLMQPDNAYENWVEFVRQHEKAWPCIQSRNQSTAELRQQIKAFQEIGRPYCIRIVRDRFPNNMQEIVSACTADGPADFVIILEGGWTRDPLTLSVWFQGVVAESFRDLDAAVPVVVSCTSIPKTFSNFSGVTEVLFSNRQLVDQISRQTNRTRVIYGDWGSTQPREGNGFARRPYDRIDYPTEGAWYIVRNNEKKWDFKAVAKELVDNSGVWRGDLGIWGEDMIFHTTISKELGIDTPLKNVAARINIHLHRQAFYGQPDLAALDFDEDWVD
ncbi:MAG: beta family protein [Rhodobacteraceae bacterium]|nr:beta family protein [Paracoccaceae bacterium]